MAEMQTAGTSAYELWREQVPQEVLFWESWVATRGREWPEDFAYRFLPEAPLQGRFGELVAGLPGDRVRLLDVGAGPVTVLGKTVPGKPVEIVAVDPLADTYAELLEREGIEPLVVTQPCDGERLTEAFPVASFDVAHARNAIDHSYDPLRVIVNMLTVVRPGGLVFLGHESNEAINERYVGLHQWNFDASADEAFVIWGLDGLIDVTERLRGLATVKTHHEDGWLEVAITRSPHTAGMTAEDIARQAGLERRFDRHLVELLVEVPSQPSAGAQYRSATNVEHAGDRVVVTSYEPDALDDVLAVALHRAAHVGLLAGGDVLESPLDLRGAHFSAYVANPALDRMPLHAAAAPECLSGWLMRAPWLESVLAQEDAGTDPPSARSRSVLARLGELREAPELLDRWAQAFTDADDLTLVVLVDARDDTGLSWLERAAERTGLDLPGAPDVLAVTDGFHEALEAVDGLLSTRPDPSGAGRPALGLVIDPRALRERVLLPPVSGVQAERVTAMRRRWDCARVSGRPELLQPALMSGPGRIEIADGAVLGWARSPGFLTGYVYVEAGLPESLVEIGPGCYINNDVCLRSEGPGISIGRDVLIGYGVHVYDSDFHAVDPRARAEAHTPRTAKVKIGDNAWIGANAMVLKGVEIGAGAVVAAGSIVTRSVPPATLVAGNPAWIVRRLSDGEDQALAGA